MTQPVITPPDQTSMTVEARGDYEVMITVERGNGASVQTMYLTTAEWTQLQFMLETFSGNWAPSVHLTFKAQRLKRGDL